MAINIVASKIEDLKSNSNAHLCSLFSDKYFKEINSPKPADSSETVYGTIYAHIDNNGKIDNAKSRKIKNIFKVSLNEWLTDIITAVEGANSVVEESYLSASSSLLELILSIKSKRDISLKSIHNTILLELIKKDIDSIRQSEIPDIIETTTLIIESNSLHSVAEIEKAAEELEYLEVIDYIDGFKIILKEDIEINELEAN